MPKTSWPKSRSVLTRERPTRPNPITANCLLIASSYRYVLLRVDVTPSLPGRKRQNQGDRSNPSEEHYPYDDQFSEVESSCVTCMESPTVPKALVTSKMAGTSLKPSEIIIGSVAKMTTSAELESTTSTF